MDYSNNISTNKRNYQIIHEIKKLCAHPCRLFIIHFLQHKIYFYFHTNRQYQLLKYLYDFTVFILHKECVFQAVFLFFLITGKINTLNFMGIRTSIDYKINSNTFSVDIEINLSVKYPSAYINIICIESH